MTKICYYDLNYYDEKFLALYREFYGFEYDGSENNEDNTWEHFTAQNLMTLLAMNDVSMGGYGFCWWESQHGPRSNEFESTLEAFDIEPELVQNFYKNVDISKYGNDRVEKIKSIICGSCPKNISTTEWIDVLASIFFVKSRIVPYEENFEGIKNELVSRRHELNHSKCLIAAWNTAKQLEKSCEGNSDSEQ